MLRTIFKLILSFTLLFFVVTPVSAQTYGSSTYGGGVYGGATPTPSPASSNPLTRAGSPSCDSIAPVDTPDLFQINRVGLNAILYFTPVRNADRYHVFYGSLDINQFGAEFIGLNKTGVLWVTVGYLQPGVGYQFMVRGVSGCAAAGFGNVLNLDAYSQVSYRVGGQRKSATKLTPTKLINKNEFEQQEPSDKKATPQPTTQPEPQMQEESVVERGLWGRVKSFLIGLIS